MHTAEQLSYLTPDEVVAWQETDAWLQAESSKFQKVLGLTRKPLEYAYGKVPESLKDSIATAIYNVLTSLRDGSAGLTSQEVVSEKIGPIPEGPLGMYLVGVRRLDGAARSLIGQSKNLCTAEGAATGVAGLPGIVVDIPALYTLLFRMIAQVAACYGYSVESEQERGHILKVLDVGHQLEPEAKRAGMTEIEELQRMIRDDVPIVEAQRFAVSKGLQSMARALGLALTQRKLAQSLAVVGGMVGAGVNRQLAAEVGEVAYHAYRRRYLAELALLRQRAELGPSSRTESALAQDDAAPETREPEDRQPASEIPEAAIPGECTVVPADSQDLPAEQKPAVSRPIGGLANVTLAAGDLNALLARLDYPVEYRHGCFLGRVKLPIGTVRAAAIPSCSESHLVFTVPFKEIKSEGAGSFLLSKILSTFWTTIAKQVESTVLPRLRSRGFSSDLLTLDRGKGAGGEFGLVKLSLPALNRWLADKHPLLRASLIKVRFGSDDLRLDARVVSR